MCIIVFCGASLEKKEIEEILGNDVYVVPPIKRGDLKKYKDGNIIAIIDGIFGGMLAISPQEIRESLELGNVILGSSSMGALRAAELEKDGMIGIGKIFQAYKSGNVDSDAEVAMIFSAKDYMPLSEPLIHIRFFVQDMIQKQVLSNGEGSTILEVSKNIYVNFLDN